MREVQHTDSKSDGGDKGYRKHTQENMQTHRPVTAIQLIPQGDSRIPVSGTDVGCDVLIEELENERYAVSKD